jgi:hypothetical protein
MVCQSHFDDRRLPECPEAVLTPILTLQRECTGLVVQVQQLLAMTIAIAIMIMVRVAVT